MTSEQPPLCPYPGLRPFEAADHRFFFGREAQVDAILLQLEDHHFVAVVGSSGSGKSSLIRAGVLPAVQQGFLLCTREWRTPTMKPGDEPYRQLAATLCADVLSSEADAELVRGILEDSDRGLLEALTTFNVAPETNILLIVDQFEELFGFRRLPPDAPATIRQRDEAAAFVRMLLRSAESSGRIRIILTMRSDFMGDCEAFLGLPEAISRSQFLVPRLDRTQMEKAIRRPGEVATPTFTFVPGLVNRIINEAGDRPDQLPLMQHALMRTWQLAVKESSDKLELNNRHYSAAGGIEHALSRHADEALAQLSNERERVIAQRLFLQLCDVSSTGRVVRRRPKVAEVEAVTGASPAEIQQVMRVFQESHRNFLLPPPHETLTSNTTLDISHEALLRRWSTFQKWLGEERASVMELRQLVALAGFQPPELLRGKNLARFVEWMGRVPDSAAWGERYLEQKEDWEKARALVRTSQAAEAKAERRAIWRRRSFTVMAALVVCAAGYSRLRVLDEREKARTAEAERVLRETQAKQARAMAERVNRILKGIEESMFDSTSGHDARALWELAELSPTDIDLRRGVIAHWFQQPSAVAQAFALSGAPLRAALGLNPGLHVEADKKMHEVALRMGERLAQLPVNDELSPRGEGGAHELLNACTVLAPRLNAVDAGKSGTAIVNALLSERLPRSDWAEWGQVLETVAPHVSPDTAKSLADALSNAFRTVPPEAPVARLTLGSAWATLAAKSPSPESTRSRVDPAQLLLAIAKEPVVAEEMERTAQNLSAQLSEGAARQLLRDLLSLENEFSSYNIRVREKVAARLAPRDAAAIALEILDTVALHEERGWLDEPLAALAHRLSPDLSAVPAERAAELVRKSSTVVETFNRKGEKSSRRKISAAAGLWMLCAGRVDEAKTADLCKELRKVLHDTAEIDTRSLFVWRTALQAMAPRLAPPEAAELARDFANLLENREETDPDRLLTLVDTLIVLAPRLAPPQRSALVTMLIARLLDPQEEDVDRLPGVGLVLAALVGQLEPNEAAGILAQLEPALGTMEEKGRKVQPPRVLGLAIVFAAIFEKNAEANAQQCLADCAQKILLQAESTQRSAFETIFRSELLFARIARALPSPQAHLVALAQLLQMKVEEPEPEVSKQQEAAIVALCARLDAPALVDVLKWPTCVDRLEIIVLRELEAKVKPARPFYGSVARFIEQAQTLGFRHLEAPAKRPQREAMLKELRELAPKQN